jgi:predicted ester cyclase
MCPAGHRVKEGTDDSAEDLIRAYYGDFNERRLDAAACRFHHDAQLEHVTGQIERGPEGFRKFAERWLTAFPDSRFSVECIRERTAGVYDVELLATGTHTGTLAFDTWIFRPTNLHVRLSGRELIDVERGRVRFASLSFDLQDLVRQLARVEPTKLVQHLARLQQLGEHLRRANGDAAKQRDLIDQIGRELDAARHVVRPYFR